MKSDQPLFKNGDNWTFEMLQKFDELGEHYMKELGFTYYPLQIEIVSPEQMLGLYTSDALPMNYNHWSFGLEFTKSRADFYNRKTGIAFEICKNTNPCLCFNMETNNAIEQASVIFHVYGHSSHFASNYLYKNNSKADLLVPYMDYARTFIKKCEDKYGINRVEHLLDLAHSIYYTSVNKYKRYKIDQVKESIERELYNISNKNYMLDKLTDKKYLQPICEDVDNQVTKKINLPEENLLYFVEKNSPVLTNWEREIIRIMRHLTQFVYQNFPGQSQILAEGTAMFTECYIMKRAYEDGFIDEGSYIEYLAMNSRVLLQYVISKKTKTPTKYIPQIRINPYFLGLAIMRDIRRMCEYPTDEDRLFIPDICGSDWRKTLSHVISNFRDDSLITQFLSPHLIKKLQMMHTSHSSDTPGRYHVESHSEYVNDIREALANINNVGNYIPDINVTYYDGKQLNLGFKNLKGRKLHAAYAEKTMLNLEKLMGCKVGMLIGSQMHCSEF